MDPLLAVGHRVEDVLDIVIPPFIGYRRGWREAVLMALKRQVTDEARKPDRETTGTDTLRQGLWRQLEFCCCGGASKCFPPAAAYLGEESLDLPSSDY